MFLSLVERQKALEAENKRKIAENMARLERQLTEEKERDLNKNIEELKKRNEKHMEEMKKHNERVLENRLKEQERLIREGYDKELIPLRQQLGNQTSTLHYIIALAPCPFREALVSGVK